MCDDNESTGLLVKNMILEYCEKMEIENTIDLFYDGMELITKRFQYDIIFLDIEMKEMGGISAAKEIRIWDKNAKIIYMTSHKCYMKNAFTVHAFDYLIKPFGWDRVEKVLTEVLQYMKEEEESSNFNLIINHGIVTFETRDIIYFERNNRKVKVISKKEEMIISNSLVEISEVLKDKGFEICHKSYLVNMFYVNAIYGFEIEMKNGDRIPLAQKRAVAFKKQLYDYFHESYNLI